MTTETVYVQMQQLLGLSDHVGELAELLRRRQLSIDDDVDELLTSWTGPAASSYRAEWDEISVTSGELIADLFYIEDLLTWAAHELDTTDDGNSGDIEEVGLNL